MLGHKHEHNGKGVQRSIRDLENGPILMEVPQLWYSPIKRPGGKSGNTWDQKQMYQW